MSNSTSTTVKYYDLHTNGAGFLNRLREVKPKAGGNKFKPFWSISIGAFRGSEEDVEYTNFDCKITGADALEIIKTHQEKINDQQSKVIAGFVIGDIYPHHYTVKDKQTGNDVNRCGIKGRLLHLQFLKVDGEMVYQYQKPENKPARDADIDQPGADDLPEGSHQAEPADCPFEEQLGNEVFLEKDDPAFEQKRNWLKTQGYQWNSQQQCWQLPSMN